MGRY